MKRDSSVELGRVLACCIVIGVHICLPAFVQDSYYDISRIFISCLVADGVAIFWFITGFFLFKNVSYKKVLNKTFKNIGIPLIVFSCVCFYFSSWLFYDQPFLQGFVHTKEEYINVIKTLLTWNNPVPSGSHLWYLYTYILIMLFFPVLLSFINYLEADSSCKRVKYFFVISFSILMLNDITMNKFANFSLHAFSAVFPAAVEIIYGHFLYKYKSYFKDKKWLLITPVCFLGMNIIRAYLQYRNYYVDAANTHILFWYTSIGVVCTTSLLIFCLCIGNYIKSKKVNKTICALGSFTFCIYMIHTYVIALLSKWGITDRINKKLFEIFGDNLFEVMYTIILIVLVFVISLIVSCCIRFIKNFVLGVFNVIKEKKMI